MIRLEKISKKYQNNFWNEYFYALKDVSFEIPFGKISGFLGANGAGKTTTIKILFDLIRADSGKVVFDKELGSSPEQIRSQIGYLPERPYFYPHLKGRDFVRYMGKLQNINSDNLNNNLKYWADRLGMSHALDRQIKSYSKGMLQRIGLIALLVHDPKIIILDEPLSGLDPIGRRLIKDILHELGGAGQQKTIFFSSHIVPDVEEICSNIVVLDKGELKFQGPIEGLMSTRNINIKWEIKCAEFPGDKQMFSGYDSLEMLPDHISLFKVTAANKDHFIRELVSKQVSIISINPIRPTLEEIIYKV